MTIDPENPIKEYFKYIVIGVSIYPFASMFFDYIDLVGLIVKLGSN